MPVGAPQYPLVLADPVGMTGMHVPALAQYPLGQAHMPLLHERLLPDGGVRIFVQSFPHEPQLATSDCTFCSQPVVRMLPLLQCL